MGSLDIVSTKKAREDLGISRSTMCEITSEMRRAGYTVTRDGNITWIKPSELEKYLLYERRQKEK